MPFTTGADGDDAVEPADDDADTVVIDDVTAGVGADVGVDGAGAVSCTR